MQSSASQSPADLLAELQPYVGDAQHALEYLNSVHASTPLQAVNEAGATLQSVVDSVLSLFQPALMPAAGVFYTANLPGGAVISGRTDPSGHWSAFFPAFSTVHLTLYSPTVPGRK